MRLGFLQVDSLDGEMGELVNPDLSRKTLCVCVAKTK